jgi:hypothetical protein
MRSPVLLLVVATYAVAACRGGEAAPQRSSLFDSRDTTTRGRSIPSLNRRSNGPSRLVRLRRTDALHARSASSLRWRNVGMSQLTGSPTHFIFARASRSTTDAVHVEARRAYVRARSTQPRKAGARSHSRPSGSAESRQARRRPSPDSAPNDTTVVITLGTACRVPEDARDAGRIDRS